MGCPSASIVTEELIQLGVKNLLSRHLRRVQQGVEAGGSHRRDLCCPAGRNGLLDHPRRPYAPAAHFDVVHAAHHAAERPKDFRRPGSQLRPVLRPYRRPCDFVGRSRVLAVEMEAAAIFTIAAMRGVRAGCLLTVSDTIGAEIVRISDDELRNAVDSMTALALDTLNALN